MQSEQADQWIVEVLQGRASAGDQARLAHWRAKDPENERRYREIEAVWARLGGAAGAVGTRSRPRPSAAQLTRRAEGAQAAQAAPAERLPSTMDSILSPSGGGR